MRTNVSLSLAFSLCLSLREVYFGALFRSEDRQPPLLVDLLSALFISAAVLANNNPHKSLYISALGVTILFYAHY